jgi:exopolyphosphatase/pppGpp-phosphohydrolase
LRVLERWSAHLRLGDSVFEHGMVPEIFFNNLSRQFRVYCCESQKFSQVKGIARSTSAMRDAENRDDLSHVCKPWS